MAKFMAMTAQAGAPDDAERDFAQARRFDRVRVGQKHLFHQTLRGALYLPLGDIARCYKRVEDSSAAICCGRASFPDNYLVAVDAGGEQKRIRVESAVTVDAILAALADQGVAVGLHARENRDEGPAIRPEVQ